PPAVGTPAFAQNRSTPPRFATAAATRAPAPWSEAASPAIAAAPISAATWAQRSASTSFTTTVAPQAARRRASAAPIPDPAPVTTARRPFRSGGLLNVSNVTPFQARKNGPSNDVPHDALEGPVARGTPPAAPRGVAFRPAAAR